MLKDNFRISVFKTNVSSDADAKIVFNQIQLTYPTVRINFDLEDCDKILRLEGQNYQEDDIVSILNKLGFGCEELL
ncbi:hypothetical protein MASR1M74_29980 [Lentimicrobium sp.]